MITVKTILVAFWISLLKMISSYPVFAYGMWHIYHWVDPLRLTYMSFLFLFFIYLMMFKFTWSRRRWLIAYLRFFTGKKKMMVVVDSSYTLAFSLVWGLLYHPYFFGQRAFFTDSERIAQFYDYPIKWVKKRLKKKKKINLFWKSISLLSNDFLQDIHPDVYKNLKEELEYYDFDIESPDVLDYFASWEMYEESYFISATEFHNLVYAHFYLFAEHSLKAQLKGAIYDLFKTKSKIENPGDLDDLVDVFYNNYVRKYVPAGAWWPTADKAAATFNADTVYAPEVLAIFDRLPTLFQLKAEYLYYLGYVYPTMYTGEIGPDDEASDEYKEEFDLPESVRAKDSYKGFAELKWAEELKVILTKQSQGWERKLLGFQWDDSPTLGDYARLQAISLVKWNKIEKFYSRKRSRLLRAQMFIRYLPAAVDLTYYKPQFEPRDYAAHHPDVLFDRLQKKAKPISPWLKMYGHFIVDGTDKLHNVHTHSLAGRVYKYKSPFTPGNWTWKHRKATPRWFYYKYKKWDYELEHMKTWNSDFEYLGNYWRVTDAYFVKARQKSTGHFLHNITLNLQRHWGALYGRMPFYGIRDIYILLFFGHQWKSQEEKRDVYRSLLFKAQPQMTGVGPQPTPEQKVKDSDFPNLDNFSADWVVPYYDMFNDGVGPWYTSFNFFYDVFMLSPRKMPIYLDDTLKEWARLTNSSRAHKMTHFDPNTPAHEFRSVYDNYAMEEYFVNNDFDFAKKGQLGFQDPASPSMEGIIDLHHDLMFFLTVIVIFVFWLLISVVYYFYVFDENEDGEVKDVTLISSLKSHNVVLEIVWTVVPSLILLLIALPSFALIYSMDELISPRLTLKVIGHQWYWSYEYNHPVKAAVLEDGARISKTSDINHSLSFQKGFDSNMVLEEDLQRGQLRLLEVNKRTYLPKDTNLRVLVTSADVLHSWAVPSLGVKVDACPGRLNQTPLFIKRAGTFYGQCSEICGVNHAFMPIVVQAVKPNDYINWFERYYDVKVS